MKKKLKSTYKKEKTLIAKERKEEILKYLKIVNGIKSCKNKQEENILFDILVEMLKPKILRVVYRFKIPGYEASDLYQEALVALSFKAIKDYDKDKSNYGDVAPFDNFAVMCIERHLLTKHKASFQHKTKTINVAQSINQDRNVTNSSGDGHVCISDIVQDNKPDANVLESIIDKEYYVDFYKKLIDGLSDFEKEIFILYSQKNSYAEIKKKMNNKKIWGKIPIKSVDNALVRVKGKAKDLYSEELKRIQEKGEGL